MFSDHYKYKLPDLPYSVDSLEPYIDAMTMQIHHNKHHQGYVNNLNAALENHSDLQKVPLIEMLKQKFKDITDFEFEAAEKEEEKKTEKKIETPSEIN